MKWRCILALGVLLASGSPGAQQVPRFAGGIDLLTVEAAVTDADGRAVTDLRPADFTVSVEGKPRKVLFARFFGARPDGVTTASIAVAGQPITVAPADNTAAPLGQVVLFLVDRESIRRGGELALLESAGRVLSALSPSDAAGALAIPGTSVAFTREHDQVRTQLAMMGGTMPPTTFRWFLTWDEALGIERSGITPGPMTDRKAAVDVTVLEQVYQRECRGAIPGYFPGDMPRTAEACDRGVIAQAHEMLRMARTHARSVLSSLASLTAGLARLRGPKHIIFLSGGLFFDQTLLADFDQAARAANAAGIVLHTIHVDQPETDASTEHRAITQPFGGRDLASGLTNLSGMTGGSFSYGVARATGVFDRIATQIVSSYELGLETEPGDAAGKLREIEVQVTRPGVQVRARKQAAIPAALPTSALGTEAIADLLRQPTDVSDLRIALNASTTRGDDESLLRVVVAAEVDAPQSRGPLAWGFAVLSDSNVVANGRQVRDPDADRPWSIAASTKLAPGTYRIRFAAVDADGRAGVVDAPLTVGMHVAGPLQASDLIVGAVEGERLVPASRIAQGADGAVLAEIWAADSEQLAKTAAVLEIVPGGSAEPVQRYRMALRPASAGPGILAEAHFRTETLPPGRYTASVVPLVDDQPQARVIKVFEIVGK